MQILLDFKTKFNKLDYFSTLSSALDLALPSPELIHLDSEDTRAFLHDACQRSGVVQMPQDTTAAKLLDKLFSKHVEPELAQPTFVLDHPVALSPLAKQHRYVCYREFVS